MDHVLLNQSLEIRNISKSFGKNRANQEISVTILSGTVHAIVGQNGAGKSTLVKILFGAEQADSGSIWISGKQASFSTPKEALDSGIGLVAQELALIDELTALDNLILGNEPINRGFLNREYALKEVKKIEDKLGIEIPWRKKVGELSVPQKQQLEVIRLLLRGASILIFDEPTAALAPAQIDNLLILFAKLKKEGKTIIFISHKLHEVFEISDFISVLRSGKLIGTYEKDLTNQDQISSLMIGGSPARAKSRMKKVGSVILKVNNLEVKDALGVTRIKGLNANFKNFAISGICGVTGNGQEEFMEALGGIIPVSVGSIRIYDQDVTHASVANRRKKGIGFIPADRKSKGIAQSASIQENTLAGFQHIISKRGLISSSQLKVHVNNILDEFKVSVEDQYLSASTLSGGNQQKLMFGREISHFPRVLVASQPTRGIDIGGSADLQNLLIEQRDKGVAVILQSEDLDELLLLSDEIFVFLAGRIVKYFERPFNKKQIGDAMVGFGNG